MLTRGEQFRVVAVDHRRRIITLVKIPADQRQQVPDALQFADVGEIVQAPQSQSLMTPEQEALHQAFVDEMDANIKARAEGHLPPLELTAAQRMVIRHMQA